MGDYDFNKALDASLEDTRKRQDDLLLQRGELESQFADVSRDTPEEKKGGWVSMLLPALIGAAVGKNRNQRFGLGLTGAGTAGTEYWNNLEADEKEKKAMIVDKLKMNQSLYQDERNQFQQLTGKGLDFQSGMQQAWEKGAIPSTDPTSPYAQNMLAEQNQSIAVNNASSNNSFRNNLALAEARGEMPYDVDSSGAVVVGADGNPSPNLNFVPDPSKAPVAPPIMDALNASRKARGEPTVEGPASTAEVSLLQRDEDLGNKKVAERRRLGSQALGIMKNMRAGLVSTTLAPNEKDAARAGVMTTGYEKYNNAIDMMTNLIQTQGISFFGIASKERDAIFSHLTDGYRADSGSGANFSIFEMDLSKKRNISAENFPDYVMGVLRKYNDPVTMIKFLNNEKGRLQGQFAEGLLGTQNYLAGYKYSPEQAKRYGIATDKKTGAAIDDGRTERFANGLLQKAQMMEPEDAALTFGDDGVGVGPGEKPNMGDYGDDKQAYIKALIAYRRNGGTD